MASGSIKKEYRVASYTLPSVSYTANVEVSGAVNLAPYNTSGYKAIGVLGYNTVLKSYVRRLMISNNTLLYSITGLAASAQPLYVDVLEERV